MEVNIENVDFCRRDAQKSGPNISKPYDLKFRASRAQMFPMLVCSYRGGRAAAGIRGWTTPPIRETETRK
jgi:hypothetical protein